MRRLSTYDELLTRVWQHVIATLRRSLKQEHGLTLVSTWVVSALLSSGLSARDLEIRDYLARLDDWVEQLDAEAEVLVESPTGLLGLWIHLRRQRRKHVEDHLEDLFLRSVEHNLGKGKSLSLSSNVDLLAAVSAGLGSIPEATQLREKASECLRVLSQSANGLESVQLLQSWELIQRTDDIPHMDIKHRLESIAANEDSPTTERAVAYYGQMRLAGFAKVSSIVYEMRLLDCLGLVASSSQDESGSVIKLYALSLPYLEKTLSYDSLSDAWQRHSDSRFKRAKAENYWARYLFIVLLLSLILVVCWPWLQQLGVKALIGGGGALLEAIVWSTVYIIEITCKLYGRQFWQRGNIEILVGLIAAMIVVATALAMAFAEQLEQALSNLSL